MTNLSPADPLFFSKLRSIVSKKSPFEEVYERIEESGIQEGSAYLAIQRARDFADLLVDEKGVIDSSRVPPLIKELQEKLYPIGFETGVEKGLFQFRALQKLMTTPELLKLLGAVDVPYREPLGERWIRISLGLKKSDPIQKREAVKAVLSAWLTPLRQNVGSCFATAPAILIQEDHPEWLLKDLKDLLETGRLKRVVQGVEHQVPLVGTIGFGSLKAPFSFQLDKWLLSPGLKIAFEAMGIPLSSLKRTFYKNPPPYLSADEALSRSLKMALNVEERDIEEFFNRPLSEPFPSLMVRTGTGGQGKRVTEYLEKLEAGRLSFILMTEHPLLKAWEYTLASFAETKGDFASWNLYASLGFEPGQSGGIGPIIYQAVQRQLDVSNRKMFDLQEEYKVVYLQLTGVETRLKLAQTEKELQWIRAEYQAKRNEFNTLEILRDRERSKGERLANLPNHIVNHFIELFPKYFQEVYDPDLVEVKVGPFDDTPAGFRLFFKHGRTSISAWTPIKNPDEFVDSLASFFQSTEREFDEEEIKGIDREIGEIITAICLQVRTKDFLITAFDRMAIAHNQGPIKDPLEHLDRIEKKPWAFTSGGTMKGLVSSYFSLEYPPREVERWVENREELLVFLLDEIKRLPNAVQLTFQEHPERGVLIHSPTHAFRLLPSLSPFSKAWKEDVFTYTWVRDYLIDPQKSFYRGLTLDGQGFERLKEKIADLLPNSHQEAFKGRLLSPAPWVSIPYFREVVFEAAKKDPSIFSYFSMDQVDALLFESLPLTPYQEVWNLLESFLEKLSIQKKESAISLHLPSILTRSELRHALSAIVALHTGRSAFPFDLDQEILTFLREKNKEPPPAILFADTNWEGAHFGFQVHPGTLDLELWKMNRLGTTGTPMSSWRQWLDGSVRSPKWGLYPDMSQFL